MLFTKPCPSCGVKLHIRKLSYPLCDHVLRRSKSHTVTVDTCISSRTRNAVSLAVKRTLETEEETEKRRKLEKDRAIRNRALETPEKADKHRKFEKGRAIRNRTLKTPTVKLWKQIDQTGVSSSLNLNPVITFLPSNWTLS